MMIPRKASNVRKLGRHCTDCGSKMTKELVSSFQPANQLFSVVTSVN